MSCTHCPNVAEHACPCPIGKAKYSYVDKSEPEALRTYTVPMVTFCNGRVELDSG